MKTDIDWDVVWSDIPSVMGLSGMRFIGKKWYGKYRMDGSPHHRWDKLVVQRGKHDGMPTVLEQGGDTMTLWSWLVRYGGLSNKEVVARLTGAERHELSFSEEEYTGPVRYVETWQYLEQIGNRKTPVNPLFSFLTGIYGFVRVSDAFRRYNVSDGLKSRENGVVGTRFWYRDSDGRICFDKTMFYGADGHRLKDCHPLRMFKRKWGYTGDCLFGEDSLEFGKTVFVVESEKTAIIGYLEYPDYNWVACGGKNGLRLLERLKGYNVYLVPDIDAADEWSRYGRIWPWWKNAGIDVGKKWDIGDLFLAKRGK